VKETAKGEYLCVTRTIPGRLTKEVLPDLIVQMIQEIPFKKTMRWGAPGVRFARPVHWIVALYGQDVLPVTFGDCSAGKMTRGTRFMSPDPFEITNPDVYVDTLHAAYYVLPDIAMRKANVWEGAQTRLQRGGRDQG